MPTFDQLADLLARRTGICLDREQQHSVVKRLVERRVKSLGLGSTAAYLQLLEQQPLQGGEFTRLIAAVTNNHTFFFRDQDQFSAWRNLMLQHRQQGRGRLAIWCAGCSTGEEPYSLAMLCADLGLEVEIVASDLCEEALELAKSASYRAWSLRHLPAGYQERFFAKQGENYCIVPEIRERVSFRFHNLMEDDYPRSPQTARRWDWILCRNVLIYFSRLTVTQIANGFADVLSRWGWLFLSSTESLHGLPTRFMPLPVERIFGHQLDLQVPAAQPRPQLSSPRSRFTPPELPRVVVPAPFPQPEPIPLPVTPEAGPTTPPQTTLYQRAVAALEADDLPRARELLQRQLNEDAEHLLSQVTLGTLMMRTHEFELAIELYQQALHQAPLLAEVHYLMGVVYRKLSDLDRAAQALRRALFLEPDFWCASFLLAGVEARLGRFSASRRNLSHTLSVLEQPPLPSLFKSYHRGIQDVDLDPEQVAGLCRQRIRL